MERSQTTSEYESQPHAGSSTSSGLPPSQMLDSTPADEAASGKRKRGRPKGSKTKNKRSDATYVPIESTALASGLGMLGSQPQDNAMISHTHDGTGDRVPLTAIEAQPPMSSQLERISDEATYSLSRGHSAPGPGPTTGTSSDITATLTADIEQLPPPTNEPNNATSIQNFYDFQWQVISLCSVFYESAGDLVRRTDPAVLAQSFQLGSRQDPMLLLQNAKEFCDGLLAKPESFQGQALPPATPASMFPVPIASQPPASTSSGGLQAQSHSLTPPGPHFMFQRGEAASPASIHGQYAEVPNNQSRLPSSSTAPVASPSSRLYSGLRSPSIHSGGVQFVSPPDALQGYSSPGSILPSAQPPTASATSSSPVSTLVSGFTGITSHGAWSEEETERLKSLAEQSKSRGTNGEIDWEWTTSMFGDTRSRHQILIKAVNLGLKPTGTHPSRLRKRMSMGNAPETALSSLSSMTSGPSGAYHPQPPSSDTTQEGQLQRFVRESVSSPQLRPPSASHSNTGSQSRMMAPAASGMSPSISATSMPSFPSQSDHSHFRPQQPHRAPQNRRLSAVHVAPSYHTSPTMGASATMQPPSTSPGGGFHGQQGTAEQDLQQLQQQSPQLQAQPPPFPYAPFRQMSRSSNPLMQPPAQPLAAPGSGTPSAPSPQTYQHHTRSGSGGQRPTSSSSASSSSRQATQQQHLMNVGQASPMTSSSTLSYPPNSMQQSQMPMPMQTQMAMQGHSEAQQQLTSPGMAARQVPHTLRRVGPSFGPGHALPQYMPSAYGGATGLGMAADTMAKTAVAPLDRVKILFQASNPEFQKYSGSWTGMFRAATDIYGETGVRGLLQGHSATLLRVFPYAAIKFMAYDQLHHLIRVRLAYETKAPPDPKGSATASKTLFRASLRRTIQTIYHEGDGWPALASGHRGTPVITTLPENTLRKQSPIFTTFPILKFYRGFSVTLIGIIPYAGTSFLVYGSLRSMVYTSKWWKKESLLGSSTSGLPPRRTSAMIDLWIGALSGMISQTVSYPFEVVRRRMQVGGLIRPGAWMGWRETVLDVWRTRGFRGFYAGLTIGYVKVVPMTAISFMVWEWGKAVLDV
ncbi:hypothetical protein FRB97_004874 [Tulasnella sp. 331]|nr:hypothetical protein FRB97_004874 [Tulasnella sp. 331]